MSELQEKANALIDDIRGIIDSARAQAVRSVDFCRVQMYWQMGKRIFEEEQQGKERADYGAYLIKNLAKELQPEYGEWFLCTAVSFLPSILPFISNCERIAFTIELDSV